MRKRDMLVAEGVPLDCLGMMCCWCGWDQKTDTYPYHAVLGIHTKRGLYVLDNRKSWVKPWRALTKEGYTWDKWFDPDRRVWIGFGNTNPNKA